MPGPRGDSFDYGPAEREWFERFTVAPADADTVAGRLDGGESLATLDIPGHLQRKLAPTIDTGGGLYRLVQLFGLPNVPGLEAGGGAQERVRERTTWQYLFDVRYEPTPEEAGTVSESFLLAVYDYRTDVSCGVAAWVDAEEERAQAGVALEPVTDADDAPAVTLPGDDDFLVGLTQLVLSLVEEPVPATHEGLWV